MRRGGFGENPWDVARRQRLTRKGWHGKPEPLDPGVNFFVEGLERLGAEPQASCDGHGNRCGFYVAFRGDEKLARRIANTGYFHVQLERDLPVSPELPPPSKKQTYSIRLGPAGPCCKEDPQDLTLTLRYAAQAWREDLLAKGGRR